jgi:hypothetical protein
MNKEEKQYLIEQANTVSEIGEVSDGYHTFNSLYNQRLYLWAALVKAYKDKAWKTQKHNDGEPCFGGGWFLVGITTPEGDYTYHYEMKDWDLFDCTVIDKAPVFDGHTDKDITRVMSLQPHSYPNWISVDEELPKVDGRYIIADKYGGVEQMNFDAESKYWWLRGTGKMSDFVTHWMSLPQPPRKEE